MVAKIVGWLIIIILVIWAIGDPAAAGHAVHTAIAGLISFATHAGKG